MEPLPSLSSSCQAYWCHQCKKEFYLKKNSQDNGEVFCLNCKSDFCEEVMDSDNNPKNYIPYEYSQVSSESPPQNEETTEQIARLENRRRTLEHTFNYFSQRLLDRYIDHLILRLMARDYNHHLTPACKKTVECLPLVKLSKEEIRTGNLECSVCKEDFQEEDEEIKQMPCKHFFHNDCLKPWLSDHNSCPVCRYALPLELKEKKEIEQNESQ